MCNSTKFLGEAACFFTQIIYSMKILQLLSSCSVEARPRREHATLWPGIWYTLEYYTRYQHKTGIIVTARAEDSAVPLQ